jgi:hypothetical protein
MKVCGFTRSRERAVELIVGPFPIATSLQAERSLCFFADLPSTAVKNGTEFAHPHGWRRF